jgi:uncharacterized phage-associated protein
MLTAHQVAEYLLTHAAEDDFISNLKLQKLLYYAQGVYLAAFGEPLFGDELEAWPHGPVVPTVYHRYKRFNDQAIPRPQKLDDRMFPDRVRKILDFIRDEYSQFSAWRLRTMTHEEKPWLEAFHSDKMIRHEAMLSYFGPKYGGLLGLGQEITRTNAAVSTLKELLQGPSTVTFKTKLIPTIEVGDV